MMKRRYGFLTAAFGAALLTASPIGAQTVTETVHVMVSGGPLAGSYDASATRGGCSTNANGPGSWGNAFSNPRATDKEIGALSLIVPNAKEAAGGTKTLFVQLRFGSILGKNTSYIIETRPDQKATGTGIVTVKESGATAQVNIDATTADGVTFKATIDCKAVVHL